MPILKASCLFLILCIPITVQAWFWEKADVVSFAHQVKMEVDRSSERRIVVDYLATKLGGKHKLRADIWHRVDYAEVSIGGSIKNKGTKDSYLTKIVVDLPDSTISPIPSSMNLMARNKWYLWGLTEWTQEAPIKKGETQQHDEVILVGLFDKPPSLNDYPSLAKAKLKIVSFESEP